MPVKQKKKKYSLELARKTASTMVEF